MYKFLRRVIFLFFKKPFLNKFVYKYFPRLFLFVRFRSPTNINNQEYWSKIHSNEYKNRVVDLKLAYRNFLNKLILQIKMC